MTITNGYATFEQLDSWLSGQLPAGGIDAANRAIEAASRWIDQSCGRHFYQITETRTFRPDGSWLLALNSDLLSVTSLVAAGTAWGSGQYQLEVTPNRFSQNGESRPFRYVEAIVQPFPLYWTGRRDTVAITGTWGWASIPAGITQACLIEAASVFHRAQSVSGVQGMGDFGVVRVSRNDDPTVMSLLAPYRVNFGLA